MAATPEAKVKVAVRRMLTEFGAYYFCPATGGYGRSGVPDFVVCFKGQFVGIEAKAGNNQPTALQQRELSLIAANGGVTFVVNEHNLKTLHAVLEELN